MIKNKRYIIALPKQGVNVNGYGSIPKIGGIIDVSPSRAVTRYLFRCKEEYNLQPKLIAHLLNTSFGGLEKFAFEFPEIEAEKGKLDKGEKDRVTEDMVAYEIAQRYSTKYHKENPLDYMEDVRRVVQGFESLDLK